MILALLLLACLSAGLLAALLLQRRRTQGQLDQLLTYLMAIQDRTTPPEIALQAEGSMKILQSELYKLSTALQEQYAREAEKNQYLADMLSNISHQIKTPLTAITLLTDLLKNDALPPRERRQCLARVVDQTDRITWLVQTLLTMAQLDAGTLTLKPQPTEAEDLMDRVYEPLAILADLRGVALCREIPPGLTLSCDPHWTREALSNIVKNCLEHTGEGGSVTVTLSQSNLSTEILIRDTGEGISKTDLPHIFDRFYRGEQARPDSVGIGLALAKQIITHQNGTIQAQSQPGQGTLFTIKLYRPLSPKA